MCSDDGDEDDVGDVDVDDNYFMTGTAPTHTHGKHTLCECILHFMDSGITSIRDFPVMLLLLGFSILFME